VAHRRHTTTVVANLKDNLTTIHLKVDVGLRAAGMSDDVREALLENSIYLAS
jgi:hypothetical protein